MSIASSAIPAVPARNRQAKGTVGILNTLRWVGTWVFIILAGLGVLTSVIGYILVTANGAPAYAILGFGLWAVLCVVVNGVLGALFYATIGWYVDSLSMLVKIEQNTSTNIGL